MLEFIFGDRKNNPTAEHFPEIASMSLYHAERCYYAFKEMKNMEAIRILFAANSDIYHKCLAGGCDAPCDNASGPFYEDLAQRITKKLQAREPEPEAAIGSYKIPLRKPAA